MPEKRRADYLAKAEEAGKRAASIRDPETRKVWTQIADEWRRLADQISRTSKF
jgi:hypothetical protein